MKVVTSREFNQDVSAAKRFALYEPVLVTDRGKPTHVLMSIEAYREISGQHGNLVQLLAAPAGAPALDLDDLRLDLGSRTGRR
ncbi:MAG: type II toxin-antitoxin system Phd/YefM family antitoxin [Sphingobium sp.]|nr:type II toxin-antitoxin system Phd/YefM family antitoxin [Sphingobium sp.]